MCSPLREERDCDVAQSSALGTTRSTSDRFARPSTPLRTYGERAPTTEPTNSNMTTKLSAFVAVLVTALVVAVIDGADAVIFTVARGGSGERVFQFIASVVIGKEAYQMAPWSTILGILMHCSIALILTATYFALAGAIGKVTKNWFLAGFLYGLGTWIFINQFLFVVVGIKSSYTALPAWPGLLNGVLAHVFLVGIPIAFFAARHRARTKCATVG